FVSSAIGNLCGKPDVFATLRHNLSHAGLAFTVSISVCGIEIRDADIDGVIKDRQGVLFFFVHEKAAAATERENGDLCSGSSESSRRKNVGRWLSCGNVFQQQESSSCCGSKADIFQKFAPGNLLAHSAS